MLEYRKAFFRAVKQSDYLNSFIFLTKLIERNVHNNGQGTFDPPLLTSAEYGAAEAVKMLIKHGANLNSRGRNGYTALMLACMCNQIECINLLLGAGANADVQNESGNTALIVSSIYGYPECMKLLLAVNAKTGIKNLYEQTALNYAIRHGHKECIKLLDPDYKGDHI